MLLDIKKESKGEGGLFTFTMIRLLGDGNEPRYSSRERCWGGKKSERKIKVGGQV